MALILGEMRSNLEKSDDIRPDVAIDWQWADGHIRAIQHALKLCAMYILKVETASLKDDLKYATDLKITTDCGAVAVRIRRPGYLQRFGDFTLRSSRRSGVRTELQKIRAGYGDWYLYAWSDGHGDFEDWILVNLSSLRQSGLLDAEMNEIPNRDGRSGFVNLSRLELTQSECLVAQKKDFSMPDLNCRKEYKQKQLM